MEKFVVGNEDIEFMCKTPLERYEIIMEKHMEEEREAKIILMFLYSVNEVIKKKYGYTYFFYIMDDNSILRLLKQLFPNMKKSIFVKSICMLDYTKLIYRFTCAKKFEVEDLKIQQLRINSWGREKIFSEIKTFPHKHEYSKIYKLVDGYMENNKPIYRELLSILNQPIIGESAGKIKLLNEKVFLKLLA